MTVDEKILAFIKQGKDNEALSLIYKSTLPKVRKFILRNKGTEEEFKDISQDAIVVIYRKVKTGSFKEGDSIEAYLMATAKNLYMTYLTRHVKRYANAEPKDEDVDDVGVLQKIITKEQEALIDTAFTELGKVCNDLLRLSVYTDMNMKEIAAKMGFLNEDVAKTKNYKCKQRLAELIKSNKGLYNFFRN